MGEIGAEVQIAPEQAFAKKVEAPTALPETWEQIRATQLSTPYSETLRAFFERSGQWRSQPRQAIPEQEWRTAVAGQVAQSNDMLQNYHNPDITMTKPGKIFAQGVARPEIGQQVLTRLYLGVDPRHAADAFRVLVDEFSKAGCMRDIDVAFNEEEVTAGKIRDNTLIVYEPLSRPDVLNKILSAYCLAKQQHPDVFNLTPIQREAIMRQALMQFKAPVDANLSFVEMDPEDSGGSWDSGESAEIRAASGINHAPKPNAPGLTDEEWLAKARETEKRGAVVLTKKSKKALETGGIKSGDQIEYKRKLSAPALIQRGTIVAK